ncbi:ribose ABC transporter permease (plasmid) [Cetobacterium somerae]|uniref:ABC transporter permease n=1 Tax=Cetobacterium somerae TaxID=188913 RepID=UPI002E7AB159|nr:ribose ABC transporter permease [Cetobacterium somerae]WVJ02281.1 ribose ABC transporter permease [Cetobacterium somerae]
MSQNIKKGYDKYGLFLILFLISGFFGILNNNFFSLYNIQNIFKQSSINGLLAFGMTFVILIGCIDLSVGSILALVGYFVGIMLVTFKLPIALVLPLGLVLGVFLGSLNGVLVAKTKLQPFIATLVTMTIYRGITLIVSNGLPVRNINNVSTFMKYINRGEIINLPISMIVYLGVFGVLWFLLGKTVFGKHLYATGGNEEAARLSTVPTNKIKIIAYSVSGFLSALAAILYAARYNSIYPNAGQGAELDAIAAVVIGGTSMSGGKGKILGTLIGALIIGILNNGLNLLGVSSFYQEVIKGVVILFAVIADRKKLGL